MVEVRVPCVCVWSVCVALFIRGSSARRDAPRSAFRERNGTAQLS